jgi:molecular chaperone HscB
VDFTSNYFEIFGLPVSYQVDLSLLADRYRSMQRKFHPDRYARKPAQEQRLAVQYAAVINQAHTELSSPLLRAQYLLSLQNMDGDGDVKITRDPQFLMQQIELREKLADLSEANDAFAILDEVAGQAESDYIGLQQVFDQQYSHSDFQGAEETVAKMQFFSKLLNETEQLEQELDD